jgi:acetoin utilization deacetylase AcuC-like enzyme
MPSPATPLVASDAHLAHTGLVELLAGREVPCFESPERATVIREALLATGSYELVAPTDHGPDPIAAVHEVELIDLIEHVWEDAVADGRDPSHPLLPDTFLLGAYAGRMELGSLPRGRHDRLGAYCFDTATPIVEGTAAAARAAVDIGLTALDRVLEGAQLAYGLCRPPGHHAGRNLIGGYCFFNNAAIAAEHLVSTTGGRVAVVDVDYHHGNGTQQIFYGRDDVAFVSLHGDPRRAYPYHTGFAAETGSGRGSGSTTNIPLAEGTDDETYLGALGRALDAVDDFDPAVVVVSLGLDTFCGDPICDLAMTTEGFRRCGSTVAARGRPLVVLQEGGYAGDALGANAVAWLTGAASPTP